MVVFTHLFLLCRRGFKQDFLLGWKTLILHVDFPFIFNHLIRFCLKDYILLNKIEITDPQVILSSVSSVNYQFGTFGVLCRYTNSKTLQILQFFCKSYNCLYWFTVSIPICSKLISSLQRTANLPLCVS